MTNSEFSKKNNSYCILAHRMTNALEFLCDYFSNDSSCNVYIHIDKKTDIKGFSKLKKYNVEFIEDRVFINWGDISMVNATLNLLRKHSGDGYVTLLSADDFPLIGIESLTNFFETLNNSNLLHYQDDRNNCVDVSKRFKYIYPAVYFRKKSNFYSKLLKRIYSLCPFKKNIKGINYIEDNKIKLYKGTQWFSFSSDTVTSILNYINNNPKYLDSFFGTFCPDEMFFHTLVKHLNLPVFHDKKRYNDCLRYIDWNSGPEYPKNLDMSDIYSLRVSRCLFARKASGTLEKRDFHYLTQVVNNDSLY